MQHLHSLAPLIQASSCVLSTISVPGTYFQLKKLHQIASLHPILHQYLGLIPSLSLFLPYHFPDTDTPLLQFLQFQFWVPNHIHLRICQRQPPILYFPSEGHSWTMTKTDPALVARHDREEEEEKAEQACPRASQAHPGVLTEPCSAPSSTCTSLGLYLLPPQ